MWAHFGPLPSEKGKHISSPPCVRQPSTGRLLAGDDHADLPLLGRVLPPAAPLDAVARELRSRHVLAPPRGLQVHHARPGVSGAELQPARTLYAVRGVLRAALKDACLAADIDHAEGRRTAAFTPPPPRLTTPAWSSSGLRNVSPHSRLACWYDARLPADARLGIVLAKRTGELDPSKGLVSSH